MLDDLNLISGELQFKKMLKENLLPFSKTQLSLKRDVIGSTFQFKNAMSRPKLMTTSLSNKLWSLLKSKAISSVPQNPKAEVKTEARPVHRKTRSLGMPGTVRRMDQKRVTIVSTKQENIMARDSNKNFKFTFTEKFDRLTKLTCANLMKYLRRAGELNELIWNLDRQVSFHVVLIMKKTEDSCEVKFSLSMKTIIKLVVKLLLFKELYGVCNSDKLLEPIKQRVESLIKRFAFNTTKILLSSTDNQLYKLYELYSIEGLNARITLGSDISIDDEAKLNQSRAYQTLDTQMDKEEVSILYELLNEDYETRFLSNNKVYIQPKADKEPDQKAQAIHALSELFGESKIGNRGLFFHKHQEAIRQSNFVKENRPITKRFTISQGLVYKNLDADTGKENATLKRYPSNSFQRDTSGSAISNGVHRFSGSKFFINGTSDRMPKDLYKQDNIDHINKALDFIEKKNFAAVSFRRFKNALESNAKENYTSKFGFNKDLKADSGKKIISGELEDTVDLFNNYFEDYNI